MAEASDQEHEQIKRELESQSHDDNAHEQPRQAAPPTAGELQDYRSEDKQEIAAQKINYTEVRPEKDAKEKE